LQSVSFSKYAACLQKQQNVDKIIDGWILYLKHTFVHHLREHLVVVRINRHCRWYPSHKYRFHYK